MAIVHFVNYKRGTQSRAAMRGVMLYVMQEKKTAWEGGPLVSGINCQPQSVYDDFLNTKLLYHKDGGVMFYHMVQSFPKGAAVDPRQAHEAARRLAEYFDGCEVLVCTHVDREHIHSHCVIVRSLSGNRRIPSLRSVFYFFPPAMPGWVISNGERISSILSLVISFSRMMISLTGVPWLYASLAIAEHFSYPRCGSRAVMIPTLLSTHFWHCSLFAFRSLRSRLVNVLMALVR